jgi:hypothetical protein
MDPTGRRHVPDMPSAPPSPLTLALLLAAVLVPAACGQDDTDSAFDPPAETPRALAPAPRIVVSNAALADGAVREERSLVITSRVGFSAVADPEGTLTLGKLLTERNTFMGALAEQNGENAIPAQRGTLKPFVTAQQDVDEHNAVVSPMAKLGTVAEIENTYRTQILDRWEVGPDEDVLVDPNGPFRLLAVVNRIDLAGDVDGRTGDSQLLAEDQRKWFGEGRLVFGLTSTLDGKPYPMTLIMEFRLPALREAGFTADTTSFEIDPTFDPIAGPIDAAAWRQGRQRWARVWRELSRHPLTSPSYKALLRDIVTVFARPENHIALRVGELVQDASGEQGSIREFEYREFYTTAGFQFGTRHARREPLACAGPLPLLADVVDEEWNPTIQDFEYSYKLRRILSPTESEALQSACGGLPFGGGTDVEDGIELRAHFARFRPQTVWPALDGDVENEPQRHALAIGSCSGCHGRETRTTGFHIAPRGPNADSLLSPFLSGPVTVTPIAGGETYAYDEIARRRGLLRAFFRGEEFANPPTTMTEQMLLCTTSPCGG